MDFNLIILLDFIFWGHNVAVRLHIFGAGNFFPIHLEGQPVFIIFLQICNMADKCLFH